MSSTDRPGPEAANKRSEGALRESDEHFHQLVASVRDYAVFLLDAGGHVLTWNTGAESIKGYRAEEIIGQHFSRFYTFDAISTGWPDHELKMAGQLGRFEDEGWRIRKDGSRFWANVVITALREDDGSVRGFLKITRDLTDRKQAEEKLRLSEERFRLMVEGVEDYAIFMLDPEGRVVTWNCGAERLKQYSAEEIVGQHFSIFYPQEALDRNWPTQELQLALRDGRVEDEGWRIRKDGSTFWANVVITALRDNNGVLQGYSKVTRDLTERKSYEEKQRQLAREEAARKAAEKAARQLDRQREQLKVTLASIGDGVIVTDPEGKVTFLNGVAQQLLGCTSEQAQGAPLVEVFPIVNEETRETVENPALRALRERAVVALANHTILLARDGREIPIEDTAAPILSADDELLGVVLVFRDVSEARRSREARLYLAAIVESSDDAIIGMTLDDKIASWNQGAERLYGYSSQEVVGKSLAILVPPEREGELEKMMKRVTRGERIEHFETERVRKDGDRVMVSLTASPVRNPAGKIIGVSKIARDITQQKSFQESLVVRNRHFRLLWESAAVLLSNDEPDAMLSMLFEKIAPPLQLDTYENYMVAPGGKYMRLVSYAGFSDPEAAEMEIVQFGEGFSGQVAQTWQSAVREGIQQSTPHPQDGYARELGLQSWFCDALVAEGRLLGTLAFGSRSREKFEPYELNFLSTLCKYVTVAYERLRLVEQLREADRRKDHFLATLAHELRNPLAPLRNGLQVIKLSGVQDEAVARAHGIMARQLTHMVRLIDDLLDMSRISRGKIALQKQRLDLVEVVGNAVEASRPLIEAEAHQLKTEFPSAPLWVEADTTRLAQVVSNLLNNAAKFTPEGGLITVKVGQVGREAALSVKDTGVGIPSEMLAQVFDVFTQVDRSLERSQGGLGIGLSLVKGLVELHDGRVTVFSEGQDKGTEFVASLPLASAQPETPEAGEQDTAQSSTRLRILVVDDNLDSAMTLAMMLELMKHDVRKAHDGVQAVRTAADYRPDLILMDIGMPEMNGYDACRLIRQEEWGKKVMLVALTGWGQQEDKRKSREAGFDEHLVKPVEPGDLERLVQRLSSAQE